MPKLNDVLKTSPGMSITRPGSKIIIPNKFGYTPKPGDEKKFVHAHAVERHDDKVGNTDDIFRAANVKAFDRMAHRMGYNPHDDEKAEFAADKGAEKQEIAVAEANEELAEMQIDETTEHTACRMAQELSDKFGGPHFVHSYTPDWRHPDNKRFGVVSKRHYDDDMDRHYKYHLVSIHHPKPFEPLKAMPMPKFKTKSSKKAVKTMKEDRVQIDEIGDTGKGVDRLVRYTARASGEAHMSRAMGDNAKATRHVTGVNRASNRLINPDYYRGLKKSATKKAVAASKPPKEKPVKPPKPLPRIEFKSAGARRREDTNEQMAFSFNPKKKNITDIHADKSGNMKTFKPAGGASNDNENKRNVVSNPFTRNKNRNRNMSEGEMLFKKNAGNPTPGQTKSKRFCFLKRIKTEEDELNERQWKRFLPRKRFSKSLMQPSEVKDLGPKDSRSANDSIDKNEHRIYETLTAQDPIKRYIHDFQKSDNSRFAGKSKEKRRQMAIGAWYHAKRKEGAK